MGFTQKKETLCNRLKNKQPTEDSAYPRLLISELSRLGRSTLQVLRSLEILPEAKVCVYIQNIGLYSLQPNGEVNPVASIMITILAEMSNNGRSNIQYRLNSGRQQYINRGGKLGRKKGSVKTIE